MKKILAAVDFSDVTGRVVEKAAELTDLLNGELRIIHTEAPEPYFIGYEIDPQFIQFDNDARVKSDRRILDEIKTKLKDKGVEAECVLMRGPTVEKILQEADMFGAELIVIGTHEHGKLYHLILGSVREDLICQSKVPVLVIPPKK